jgi:hypothetical protein
MPLGDIPWQSSPAAPRAIVAGVTALGIGTMTWGIACSWLPARLSETGVPLASGCATAALMLVATWGLGRFRVAPRWWFGALLGMALGGACVPTGGMVAVVVFPVFGALAGAFGFALLHVSRVRDAPDAPSLDRLPRDLARAGVWLSLTVLGLLYGGHHFLAPWLRLVALVATGLTLAAAAIRWLRARWLRRVASGREERWTVSRAERTDSGLPELSGPRALESSALVRHEPPGPVYRSARDHRVARITGAWGARSALALALAALALLGALRVDPTDEASVVDRCVSFRSALEGRRWGEAYGVMSPQYRAAHSLDAFQAEVRDPDFWAPANGPRVSNVAIGWSDAWLYLHGDSLDLGTFSRRWIKIDGEWFLTDERSISVD